MAEAPNKFASWLSEKTWIPLSLVASAVGMAVFLTNLAAGIQQQFLKVEYQNDHLSQRVADLTRQLSDMMTRKEVTAREEAWSAWVVLMKAKMPKDLADSIPNPPTPPR